MGSLLSYMKRDERWLSFNVACATLACICFAISTILYMMIGVPAHTFCLMFMLVGGGLMIPCILMWNKLRKAEKQRKKKLRETNAAAAPAPTQTL